MLRVADAAAEIAEHIANHSAHGYSQPNRAAVGTGGGKGETITLSDGRKVQISTGDRDCSSMAIECYAAQGIDCGGAWYTGDMIAKMTASGNFRKLPASTWRNPERGDLLVATGKHTAIALGNGQLAEALRSEHHTAHGSVGDQDGGEILIRGLYDDEWDAVLRYCGPEMEGDLSAEDVWNFEINGVKARDRLIGIDNAANGANNELHSTADPTGRDMRYTTHDHVKWMAANQSDFKEMLAGIVDSIADIRDRVDALAALIPSGDESKAGSKKK